MNAPPLSFRVCVPDRSPARDLIAEMVAETAALLGGEDGTLGDQFASAGLTSDEHGTYLVGWLDDEPVAGGGLRRVGSHTAEIKRMYVRPAWRRRGYAAALLAALEEAARRRGCRLVRLDAGAQQVAARNLYERAGYRRVPAYNDDRYAAFWGEKDLDTTTS